MSTELIDEDTGAVVLADAPNSIQATVKIVDEEGAARTYQLEIGGVAIENHANAAQVLGEIVTNTIQEHYAPRQLMREVTE